MQGRLTQPLPPLPEAPGPPQSSLQTGTSSSSSSEKLAGSVSAQAGRRVALGGCYFRARSTASSFMATARSPFTCNRPLM